MSFFWGLFFSHFLVYHKLSFKPFDKCFPFQKAITNLRPSVGVCIPHWMRMCLKLSYGAFFNASFKMVHLISAFFQKSLGTRKDVSFVDRPVNRNIHLDGQNGFSMQYQTETKLKFNFLRQKLWKVDPVMF